MLKAIDYFCGGGGMSLGLAQAGVKVLAGIDNDPKVKHTYLQNNKNAKFILSDISNLAPQLLAKELKLERGDDSLILVGCSPCQYWSLINTDKSKSKKTAFLLDYFQKHIEYFIPAYIIIENVPGLSINNESPLKRFKSKLVKMGYTICEKIINCNDYGVPQNRIRYLLLASRMGPISIPKPRTGRKPVLRDAIGKGLFLKPIPAGNIDESGRFHSTCKLSDLNHKRIAATPIDGGNRLAWKDRPDLQVNAYIGKDNCFRDVYARMYWDRPAPTITTKFISYSNGRFGHPEQNRALSVREGAAIQTFPSSFKIVCDSISDAARIIGNAVPPKIAKTLGNVIRRVHNEKY